MSDPVIVVKPRARLDFIACYAYIGERKLSAARRFRQAAEATLNAIAQMPGIGAPYAIDNPRLDKLRCVQVRRFKNYLIFYQRTDGRIDVIRVLHAARDVDSILMSES
jgi:toxin ParE1/3/4